MGAVGLLDTRGAAWAASAVLLGLAGTGGAWVATCHTGMVPARIISVKQKAEKHRFPDALQPSTLRLFLK